MAKRVETMKERYGDEAIGTNHLGKDIFTTGQVSRIMGTSPKVVNRWCDQGKLPCVRVGWNRRVQRSDLEAFLKAEGYTDALETLVGRREAPRGPVLLVGGNDFWINQITQHLPSAVRCHSLFAAGALCVQNPPAAVVFDDCLGRNDVLNACLWLQQSYRVPPRIVVLLGEDAIPLPFAKAGVQVCSKPIDAQMVATAVLTDAV